MSIDHSDEVGFPAEATRVHRTPLVALGQSDERNRKRELFPARYDNRPLHVRALERRVPVQSSWEALVEERRRYG